jgi:hypothetical protein
VHPSNFDGESHGSGERPSFNIILPQLIKYFNIDQAILLKHFPDKMLSVEQRSIKQTILDSDRRKEANALCSFYVKELSEAAERGEALFYRNIPYAHAEQMRQAVLKSGICFATQANIPGYLTIVIQ